MKKRLDVLVTERGLCPSREKAKRLIMAGAVYVNGQKEDKAGSSFEEDVSIRVSEKSLKYVSRGGLKLEKALEDFPIDLSEKICVDIGASTGGFTDVMLKNGAAKVYSVDVGYGQLDYFLRNDERVVCMEKTNFRNMDLNLINDPISFASCDVSFISLDKMFPNAYRLLEDCGQMVCLIKPQFEAGREKIGKNGVVRDKKVHGEVIRHCVKEAARNEFTVKGLSYSPIKGPKGNIEYLLYICKDVNLGGINPGDGDAEVTREMISDQILISEEDILRIINKAHEVL